MAKRLPEKIGKYTIETLIAKGGMGAVFKAVHPTLHRPVILKKLTLRGSASVAARFKREAQIMMDFKNDYIVDVYDHFKEGQSYYIVLEYVDGTALDRLLKQERYLPNDIALLIFMDACKALYYAHNKKVIHRDIKPGNILLSKKGEIKLVDFGIARNNEEEQDETLTREGMTLGTPSYMAPEQFQNTKNVDHRADIYSMGVMLYEMVTGKKPFPGAFTPDSILQIQKGKYKQPQKINPRVSPFIKRIIKKTINPKPSRRYQDLEKVINSIAKYLKRSNIPHIRERLIKLIHGEPLKVEKKRTGTFQKILTTFTLIIVLLGGGGAFAYFNNYQYEYLLHKDYGALKIILKIPNPLKSKNEIFYNAEILREEEEAPEGSIIADIISEKMPVNILFNETEGEQNTLQLESRFIYLPSGHYRLKVNYEDQIIWKAFFLNPRDIQRTGSLTARGRVEELRLPPPAPRSLSVKYKVTDQVTGKDITNIIKLMVQLKNVWAEYKMLPRGTLKSGNTYQFNFYDLDGNYYQKQFNPFIKQYQDTLNFDVILTPKPGIVTIKSNIPKPVALEIDGKTYYRSNTRNGDIEALPPVEQTLNTIYLLPGKYTLSTAAYKGKSGRITIEIYTNQTINLNLTYDENSKELILK